MLNHSKEKLRGPNFDPPKIAHTKFGQEKTAQANFRSGQDRTDQDKRARKTVLLAQVIGAQEQYRS